MRTNEVLEDQVMTNEEKRVEIYTSQNKCTLAENVTANTPLSELNLNWTEKELPERIRTKHVNRLHPYLGKFIPQLVEIFLRKYYKAGDTVLDPFCGSGTTLVQANEIGINSIGFDISIFNTILCKVKTDHYDIDKFKVEVKDILEKTKKFSDSNNKTDLTLFNDFPSQTNNLKTENEYLNKWFSNKALQELLFFKDLIKDYEYQDALKVILSRSARSARLTTHFDLDFPKNPQTEPYHCYKHGRICQPTQEAIKFLVRYGLDTVKRIDEFSMARSKKAFVEIHNVDSRFAKCKNVNGIITSPPYVGLIDYHEQHKYAYNFFDLENQSDKEIGAAKKGTSKKAKEQYKEDMAAVFLNTAKYVKKDGKIIVIAGDKDNLYEDIGKMAGLKLEDQVIRHVNRRTGRRATEFYETIFIFSKD